MWKFCKECINVQCMNKMHFDICCHKNWKNVDFLWIFMTLLPFSGACQLSFSICILHVAVHLFHFCDWLCILFCTSLHWRQHYQSTDFICIYASENVYFNKPSLILFVFSIFFIMFENNVKHSMFWILQLMHALIDVL